MGISLKVAGLSITFKLVMNNGYSAADRIAERLNLPHVKWLPRLVKSLDMERLKAAQYRALATTTKAREGARRQGKKKVFLEVQLCLGALLGPIGVLCQALEARKISLSIAFNCFCSPPFKLILVMCANRPFLCR